MNTSCSKSAQRNRKPVTHRARRAQDRLCLHALGQVTQQKLAGHGELVGNQRIAIPLTQGLGFAYITAAFAVIAVRRDQCADQSHHIN